MKEASRRPIKARNTQWASRVALALAKKGIRPNQISIASIFFALSAAGMLVTSLSVANIAKSLTFLLAALLIQGRLLCNLFDGMVAVEGGFKTKSGAIYNDLPDRIADPLILIATGYACHIPSLGWTAALLSLLTAYIRYLGAASGATELFIGPMAKQHRMATCTAALIASTAFPHSHSKILAISLTLIIVLGAITCIRRTVRIIRELEMQ